MADDQPVAETPRRSQCGRADLVTALGCGDPALLDAVAARLGFERREQPLDRGTKIPRAPPSDNGADGGVDTGRTPLLVEHALASAPFWQSVAQEALPATPPATLADGPVELPVWSTRPAELARGRPLAEWRELLPRLRSTLAAQAETRTLDLPAIVRRLGRGESLEHLPHRRRPRWGGSLYIIEDRSDHLAPYWDDQEQVRHELSRLFPHYAVEHALWFEGLRTPVPADPTRARQRDRSPAPGSLVLVLGDLGCLLRGGAAERRHWLELGQRLAADGCRAIALTPAPRCPLAMQRYWQLLRWERSASELDEAARARAVNRLLGLAAATLRLEPGLLRELRLLIGADAGIESELWQDPGVIGWSAVAATLSPAQAERRRATFRAESPQIREQVLALQRAWRAGLPSEIWFAEIQTLSPPHRVDLVSDDDVGQSEAFVTALGRQAAGVRGAAPTPGAIPWFRDLAAWLPSSCLEDPTLGDYFYRIWAEILRRDPHQVPPSGMRPERLPVEQPMRRVALSQRGGALVAAYAPDGGGSLLANVESANGLISIKGVGDSDDPKAFWATGQPPTWAGTWGWDDYGAWVTFSVKGKDGTPVVQRMRWIEPSEFLMGSPDDEPGRYDDEGPQHAVAIGEGYWLFDTPCTQALWEALLGDNPSRFKDPDRPVENVSWNDTLAFIGRLNKVLPGLGLGLPSEARWEYACRAGTATALYTGGIEILGDMNAPALDPIAWYGGNSGVDYDLVESEDSTKGWWEGKQKQYLHERAGTRKVRGKQSNRWGLYDMLGNVWEWTQDTWHDGYEGAPADGSAWEIGDAGAGRVVRGGSWSNDAGSCRSAYRSRSQPDYRRGSLGFRCARVQASEPGKPGAERADPARRGPRERIRPGGARSVRRAGVGESTDRGEDDETPVLLRLESAAEVTNALPRAPAILIRTDRQQLTLCRITEKPPWASAIGRDRFGLWSEITIAPSAGEPVIQRLRWIPPGRFMMGSPHDEPGRLDREGPQHEVLIGKGYWLFDTPCTQALWEAVLGYNPSEFKTRDRPVEQVSWKDAQRFLGALNRFFRDKDDLSGTFVLPSEAQWEYACRAGTVTALYTGPIEILGDANAPALDPIAWYGGNSNRGFELDNGQERSWLKDMQYPEGKAGTHRVKGKQSNPWGLYDMLGNVYEWVQDAWHDSYQDAPSDGSVWESDEHGAARVIRGGSWNYSAGGCRSAFRSRYQPDLRDVNLGFRCARVQDRELETSQGQAERADSAQPGPRERIRPGGDESAREAQAKHGPSEKLFDRLRRRFGRDTD